MAPTGDRGRSSRFTATAGGSADGQTGAGSTPDSGSTASAPGQLSLFLIGTALFIVGLGVVMGFQGVGDIAPEGPVLNGTDTPTAAGTGTGTPSPTVTRTPTPTASPTATPTPTPTDDGGIFDDDDPTPTPEPSPTPTDDDGIIIGSSDTPTATRSPTPTSSPTPSETATATPWPTETQSETQQETATPYPSTTEESTYTASNSVAAATMGVWSLVVGLLKWLTLALLGGVTVILELR